MTLWQAPSRPLVSGLAGVHAGVGQVAGVSLVALADGEVATALVELGRLGARVRELELRVAAEADRRRLGEVTGAASTAVWWAVSTGQTRAGARRAMTMARALDSDRHAPVRHALARGEVLTDQAQVLVEAIEALPRTVEVAVVDRAQSRLLGLAADHDAGALRVLGRRILDVVAPEVAEAEEARQLAAEEAHAEATTRFTMADDGHGRCHGRFTVPTAVGQMLRKQLLALAAPRHRSATHPTGHPTAPDQAQPAPAEPVPTGLRLGHAFAEWVETYPAQHLPTSGGVSATVVVTMTLETLHGALGAATLDTGARLSAGQARRLACEAGLVPAVLGGESRVLDLGRTRRLHDKPQRLAMALRDGGCTAEGCDMPPGLCHAHHDIAWSHGGPTSLDNGRLLCHRHHRLAHDQRYTTTHTPAGTITFHRRE